MGEDKMFQRNHREADMKILVLGQSGLLGSYLAQSADKKDKVFFPDRNQLNIKDTQKFYKFIAENEIELCINASGLTNVYLCETNVSEAFKVNAYAPAECSKICFEKGVRFIQISTGFVFDGKKGSPYIESDTPSPINAYGESKYRGELFIQRDNQDALIVRTNEIFGKGLSTLGHNMMGYMITQILTGKGIIVYPIRTSPVYALDLSKFLWSIKDKKIKGIIHAVNSGSFTYVEIAEMISKLLKSKSGIKKRSDILKYKLPEDCSLETERFKELNLTELRPFQEAIKDCLKEFL
jgi:dTDP-4-dehydrorhamnose reductase